MKFLYSCIFSVFSSPYCPFPFLLGKTCLSVPGFSYLFVCLLQSLSSFSLVIITLLRQMLTRTVGSLAFSPCTHSMETHISSCKLGPLATLDLCTVLIQPEHHPFTAHRPTIILLSQLFGKGRKHHLPLNVRRWTETPFSVLALVRNHKGVELHFDSCLSRDCCKQEEVCMPVSFPSNTSPPSAHLSLHIYLLLGNAPVHVLLDRV